VASLQIQYDRNAELAQKLSQEIQTQGLMKVTLSQSSPPDSPAISYERNRVTVIVHSR
jgi:endonuclease G